MSIHILSNYALKQLNNEELLDEFEYICSHISNESELSEKIYWSDVRAEILKKMT